MNIGFNAVTKRIFLSVSDYYTARLASFHYSESLYIFFFAKLFQCAKRKLSFTFTVEDNDVGKYILVYLRPSLNSILRLLTKYLLPPILEVVCCVLQLNKLIAREIAHVSCRIFLAVSSM
jgi:hypothetical protein